MWRSHITVEREGSMYKIMASLKIILESAVCNLSDVVISGFLVIEKGIFSCKEKENKAIILLGTHPLTVIGLVTKNIVVTNT